MADAPTDSNPPSDTPAEQTPATDAPTGEVSGQAAETPAAEDGSANAAEGASNSAASSPEPEAAQTQPPAAKPIEIPEVLRPCIEEIRVTLGEEINERDLVKTLKRHVRELKKWPEWSENARRAYAHLIAAEIVHNQAANLCISQGVDLNHTERAEYEHQLHAMQVRNPR